jgi:putative endonuclease
MAKKHAPVKAVYFVYTLRCADDSLYTGITTDVNRRYAEHLAGLGAAYTRSHKPVAVVYTEKVGGRGDAQKREAAMKKMSKLQKEELVRNKI